MKLKKRIILTMDNEFYIDAIFEKRQEKTLKEHIIELEKMLEKFRKNKNEQAKP